jgi:hypothetical protein
MPDRAGVRRPPLAVFIPSVVLLVAGAGMVVAALVNLVLARTAASVGVAVVAAAAGPAAILAAWHLYGGDRRAWLAAMVLLPVAGAAVVLDAYAFGTGRLPAVRLIGLGLTWACLYLPSTRAFVAAGTAQAAAPAMPDASR